MQLVQNPIDKINTGSRGIATYRVHSVKARRHNGPRVHLAQGPDSVEPRPQLPPLHVNILPNYRARTQITGEWTRNRRVTTVNTRSSVMNRPQMSNEILFQGLKSSKGFVLFSLYSPPSSLLASLVAIATDIQANSDVINVILITALD